ncbi:MAG: hypothetical protein E7095_07490 [Bacteroides sp.]|nr:hypothetical protein [Bacteroides sp.]
MMKRIIFIFITIVILSNNVFGQSYTVNDFVGTWRYENNDTVFTIVLKEGKYINFDFGNLPIRKFIFGGYSLRINGTLIDDFTSVNNTLDWDLGYNPSLQRIYIEAMKMHDNTNGYVFTFYDQRKRHFGGKGISGGFLTLLAPNKLKWEIDEEIGIWSEIEGCEDCPEVSPIGFSVPNNVVLTKVLQ